MTTDPERCALCGEPLDFARATVVLGSGEPSYQPFGEDWRGGLVPMAHPRCFIERDGTDRFLEILARSDELRRGGS